MTVIPISSAPGYSASQLSGPVTALRVPVAPMAFCRMQFASEGAKTQALTAAEVVPEIEQHKELTYVEFEGPGDPLASLSSTMAAISAVKKHSPALAIGITTLGLGGSDNASALAAVGVSRVTLLVDTLDEDTADKLYAWIRPGRKTVPKKTVLPLLISEQAKAVQSFVAAGVPVTIRAMVYPGVNAHQIVTIAETMADLGASTLELVPFVASVPAQENAPASATRMHMEQIAKLTSAFLPTTSETVEVASCGCEASCGCGAKAAVNASLPKPSKDRPRVAVASSGGMDVDLHLGQAQTLLIYGPREDGLNCLLETRQTPAAGQGESRWDELAATLHDCFALLAASAGQRPREVLAGYGIRVLVTEENIEGTVDVLYGGGKKNKCK